MSTTRRVRMSDVAREAGVNRITVSRALWQPDLVAESTRSRVLTAVKKTGYVPDQIARGLKSDHSRMVSMVAPAQLSGVYGAFVEQMSRELYERGLIVNLFPLHDSVEQGEAVLHEVAGWRPAAIVLFGTHLSDTSVETIANARVPVVQLLSYTSTPLGLSVGYDQREAGRMLTNHLLERGFRKILYVHAARSDDVISGLRIAGFIDAIGQEGGTVERDTEGAPVDDRMSAFAERGGDGVRGLELIAPASYRSGNRLMSELAGHHASYDTILFASDLTAIGALELCNATGLAVPAEIGMAAFDGTDLTAIVPPGLTCLDSPYKKIISLGIEHIVQRTHDRSLKTEVIRLPINVLPRASTRGPSGPS